MVVQIKLVDVVHYTLRFQLPKQKVKKDRLIAGYLLSYVRHVLLGEKNSTISDNL